MKNPLLKDFEDDGSSFLDDSEKELLEDVYVATEEEILIQTLGKDQNGVDLTGRIAIIEENIKVIIQRLKFSSEAKDLFIQEYPEWEDIRKENINELESIGKSLHILRKNCNISRLVGNCTSFIGGGICIASVALTPLTFGLTTPLAIAGGTVTVLGSATSVGSTITEMAKLRSKVKDASCILERDKKSFQTLKMWLTHATELSEALDKILTVDEENNFDDIVRIMRDFVELIFASKNKTERNEMVKTLVKSTIRKIPRELIHSTLTSNLVSLLLIIALLYNRNRKVFDNATKTLKVIANIVSLVDFSVDVLQSASAFVKSEVTVAATVSKSVTKAAVAVFGMTLDAASIALTSVDIHNGSLSGEGKMILGAANKLRLEANILKKVYSELIQI